MTAPPLSRTAPDALPSLPLRGRRSWCRRHMFATSIVAMLAAVLALRLMWGWYCAKQLAAAWEEVRRQGDPTTPADLAIVPLPDRENAWIVYVQAVAAINRGVKSPRASVLEYSRYPPFGPKWHALAAGSEKSNAAVFPIARRARSFVRSQFPPPHPSQKLGYNRGWSDARDLAIILADGALYSQVLGNDAESVERLLDVFHLARSVRQDQALIPQLVGMGIDGLALHAAQQIVPSLKLDGSAAGTPASGALARALIAAMLDEEESRESLARSLRWERVFMLDGLGATARGTWVIRPLADRTAVRWLREMQSIVEASERQSLAEARLILRTLAVEERPDLFQSIFGVSLPGRIGPRYAEWFATSGRPGFTRTLEQFHRASAERRATAMIVAARLYRHDHDRWPDDAAALVPKYLDELPSDPFRADGGPLGYVLQKGTLPDGGDRPLVYFEAGEPDAKKDVINAEPTYGYQADDPRSKPGERRREFRQYRDVSLWTPTTRRIVESGASMQGALRNNPNEPDAPGDDAKQDNAPDGPADQ